MASFDQEFARLFLEICRYTYASQFSDADNRRDKEDALTWINNTGGLITGEPIVIASGKTSVASVSPYPDKNVISYMGTKTQFDNIQNAIASGEDWTQNFEVNLVPFKLSQDEAGEGYPANVDLDNLGGRVHEGFLEELRTVQAKIVLELFRNGGRERPVYVTGHSQGGAEAALATRALQAGGFNVAATYTFGAPRAGDQGFVESVPSSIPVHRIEFGDDIVPHVPPALPNDYAKTIVDALLHIPFLKDENRNFLKLLQKSVDQNAYFGLGNLCYGSNKTKAIRVDMPAHEEAALFYDRVWSLIRHPERWGEHHHLDGTKEEVSKGRKGNYTALVSDFQIVAD